MTKVEKTSIFNRTLEAVEALPTDEQILLVNLVKNRLKQKGRDELLEAVKESREAFQRGDVKSGTVAELIQELEDE
jgi:hypothetical protein